MITRRPGGLVILIALLASGAVLTASAPSATAAGLLVADGRLGGRLRIEKHSVDVRIRNEIAVTEVTQVFRNTEDRQVEALYTFPVPKGASVSDFSMWIGGKEMIGEVVEKRRAREIYDSYKPARRDPGLLEQTDAKTFEMRIFPIAPRAAQKVRITYYQELDRQRDQVTYVYPLAMEATRAPASAGARRRGTSRTTADFAMNVRVRSTGPVVSVSSPSHGQGFALVRHADTDWQATLRAADADLNRDVVLSWRLAHARTGMELLACRAPGEDGYFCLTVTADEELPRRRGGADYVFVLDVSGSMAEDHKLALSRDAIGTIACALGREDRFEILTFDARARALFGRLVPARSRARRRAREFLAAQRARESTMLGPAVSRALRYAQPGRPLNVVIFSDGLTEQDERSALSGLTSARPANTRVFCLGVGNEVDRPLLRQLAEEAGGLADFLSREDDLGRKVRALRRTLSRPSARNVQIDFAGVEVCDLEPGRLPDLHPGRPIRVYGRYRGGGKAQLTFRADVDGSPLVRTVGLAFPGVEAANPQIERMWAWHRVQGLRKQAGMAKGPEHDRLLWEIVRLGMAFSIATEHTSFLVLENDAEYRRWKIEQTNALRLEWDRTTGQAARDKLRALRDRAYARTRADGAQGRGVPTVRIGPPVPPGGRELRLDLPRPRFTGTPSNIRIRIRPLRPPIRDRRIILPARARVRNVARGKPVTSSDEDPILGDLAMVTDGDKEGADGSYVEIGPGRQWVQIDLKAECLIYVILLWHYHSEARVYKDVVVQVANDPDFVHGVRTLYNNDHDNSLGLGVGKDLQYLDDFRGEAIQPAKRVRARYVRFYSNGNTSNDLNHYTEAEIWGRRVD